MRSADATRQRRLASWRSERVEFVPCANGRCEHCASFSHCHPGAADHRWHPTPPSRRRQATARPCTPHVIPAQAGHHPPLHPHVIPAQAGIYATLPARNVGKRRRSDGANAAASSKLAWTPTSVGVTVNVPGRRSKRTWTPTSVGVTSFEATAHAIIRWSLRRCRPPPSLAMKIAIHASRRERNADGFARPTNPRSPARA